MFHVIVLIIELPLIAWLGYWAAKGYVGKGRSQQNP